MSQDKSTYNMSDINALVRSLIKGKKNYHLGVLGKVEAIGIHDELNLHILIYSGGVVLEQLRRSEDVNEECYDAIVAQCFNFDEVPEKFPLIRVMDYYDYTDCKEFQNYVSTIHFKKFVEQFLK